MLRHTCLTRLREAGMALEAVQAKAGHRSIETTRIDLLIHPGSDGGSGQPNPGQSQLSTGWLAAECHQALKFLDREVLT